MWTKDPSIPLKPSSKCLGPQGGSSITPMLYLRGPSQGVGGCLARLTWGCLLRPCQVDNSPRPCLNSPPTWWCHDKAPPPISNSLPHTIPRDPYSTWNKACLILVSHCQDPNADLLVNLYYRNYFYMLYIYMIRLS